MQVEIFSFPTQDHPREVELKFCELINRYRGGEKLEPEVLDWMDTANNWLMEARSKM